MAVNPVPTPELASNVEAELAAWYSRWQLRVDTPRSKVPTNSRSDIRSGIQLKIGRALKPARASAF